MLPLPQRRPPRAAALASAACRLRSRFASLPNLAEQRVDAIELARGLLLLALRRLGRLALAHAPLPVALRDRPACSARGASTPRPRRRRRRRRRHLRPQRPRRRRRPPAPAAGARGAARPAERVLVGAVVVLRVVKGRVAVQLLAPLPLELVAHRLADERLVVVGRRVVRRAAGGRATAGTADGSGARSLCRRFGAATGSAAQMSSASTPPAAGGAGGVLRAPPLQRAAQFLELHRRRRQRAAPRRRRQRRAHRLGVRVRCDIHVDPQRLLRAAARGAAPELRRFAINAEERERRRGARRCRRCAAPGRAAAAPRGAPPPSRRRAPPVGLALLALWWHRCATRTSAEPSPLASRAPLSEPGHPGTDELRRAGAARLARAPCRAAAMLMASANATANAAANATAMADAAAAGGEPSSARRRASCRRGAGRRLQLCCGQEV